MQKTCYSLFSGCGGSDRGMVEAGYQSLGGIELNPEAAKIYNLNHSAPVTVKDLLHVVEIPTVDLLWVSPPCCKFSKANLNGKESVQDIFLAKQIARLVKFSKPRAIAIENVPTYLKSQSCALVLATIEALGYEISIDRYCAADFGAPTKRTRLIIRASIDKPNPVERTYAQIPQPNLFTGKMPARWVGWLSAIAHRIDRLEDSFLTDKQKSTLRVPVKSPVLLERSGYYYGTPKVFSSGELAPTIRSHQHYDGKGSFRVAYNLALPSGAVKSADIGCLAAWQGFPPDFNWGTDKVEAAKAIGNAVPPPLAKAIALSF